MKSNSNNTEHQIQFSNTRLVLVSLFLGIFVWLLAKQHEFDTDVVDVAVVLKDLPPHINAAFEPEIIQVGLSFPKGLKAEMLSSNFAIELDARAMNLGSIASSSIPLSYPLKQSNFAVRSESLPATAINLLKLVPETIQISANYNGADANVRPKITGVPPPGYWLNRQRTRVNPESIYVVGDPISLNQAREDAGSDTITLETKPIDIGGLIDSTVKEAELIIPEGLIVLDSEMRLVEVSIAIEEVITEVEQRGIPIIIPEVTNRTPEIIPDTADIRLKGPRSLVQSLKNNNFIFLLKDNIDESRGNLFKDIPIEVRLKSGKDEMLYGRENEVSIVSVTPSLITIRYPAPGEEGS
jgi:hypothetical protein